MDIRIKVILNRINTWADGDHDTREIMELAAFEIQRMRKRCQQSEALLYDLGDKSERHKNTWGVLPPEPDYVDYAPVYRTTNFKTT